MWELVKKYWDLLSGFIVGLALCFMAHYDSEMVRQIYSIVILVLACMGLFRLIRQAVDKKKKRKDTLIDVVVDNLTAVKAINLAQEPTKEGEKIRNLFTTLWGGKNYIMKKLKTLFDKYKGYLLTIVMGALTFVEAYGGFINQLCGGVLMVNGVAVLPAVTLVLTIVFGIISDGHTKEQIEKIKALFSKSSTNELVNAEIKKKLKDNSAKHTQFVKILSTKESEKANLISELEGLKNTYYAKKEMFGMTPQLATEDDVLLAHTAVRECESKITSKDAEIAEVQATVSNLETMINALRSKL